MNSFVSMGEEQAAALMHALYPLASASAAADQYWPQVILSASTDCQYAFDLHGRFCYVNDALARLLQRSAAAIIGLGFSDLGYPPVLADVVQRQIEQVSRLRQPLRWGGWFNHLDGRTNYYEHVFVPVFDAADASDAVIAVAGTSRDLSQQRRRRKTLRAARGVADQRARDHAAQLIKVQELLQAEIRTRQQAQMALLESQRKMRHLAAHREHIKAEERKRIAREIHDELGQNLLALRLEVLQLQARTAGGSHPALHQRVSAALGHIDLTMRSMRSIINDLRPAALDLGLSAAIEWQVQEFRHRTGIACVLDAAAGHGAELDDARALALFRILQESLSNIARHAAASCVQIVLRADGQSLCMEVVDDGAGMDATARNKQGSFGLLGMRERVQRLHGSLQIDSAPGDGTRLTVSLPLPAATDVS